MKLIDKLFKKRKTKIIEAGLIIETSHTYIILPEKDEKGNRIAIPFTNDAVAYAFLIGYAAKLQEINEDKECFVCCQLDGTIINHLIFTNQDRENMEEILRMRDKGEERAEKYMKTRRQ